MLKPGVTGLSVVIGTNLVEKWITGLTCDIPKFRDRVQNAGRPAPPVPHHVIMHKVAPRLIT